MEFYTYIAASFDHDKNAVDHVYELNREGKIHFYDAHALQQSYDTSLNCSIKSSLLYRLKNSYRFVLIVGSHTDSVSLGGCQLCQSYNSYGKYCVKGRTVDYRSFIKFECEKAVELGLKIIVLYKSTSINKELCPDAVRYRGTHQAMIKKSYDGQYYWDDNAIAYAFRG